MPLQNGVMKRLYSWVADAAAGKPISAVEMDSDANDIAGALSDTMERDGTSTATADLPMGGHTVTGIRQAAAAGEPVEFAQAKGLIAAGGGAVSNRLQNASFLVNQRSVSGNVSLGSGAYGHDRWKGGAGGCAYSFAVVGADVQVSIGSGSLQQVVVASDVDQTSFTLSNAGTAQGRAYPLGGAAPAYAACPVTVTGISPGTPLVVEFGPGTVLEPQLEPGATAHGFARRALPLDTILCQAFYEILPADVDFYTGGSVFKFPIFFRARKMAVPTVTITPVSNPYGYTPQAQDLSIDGFTFFINSGSSNYALIQGLITASCEP